MFNLNNCKIYVDGKPIGIVSSLSINCDMVEYRTSAGYGSLPRGYSFEASGELVPEEIQALEPETQKKIMDNIALQSGRKMRLGE